MTRPLALSVFLACTAQTFAQSQVLVKVNVAATDSKGAAVTDLTAADFLIREDGKPRPVVFFSARHPVAQPGPGEFVNRQSPPPTVILLDRWNETETTMATAWQDVGTAVGRLETVDRVYIYFLANHGELVPVRPLPGVEADLRAQEPPSAAALIAKLNDAVRSLSGLRDLANIDPVVRADSTMQALNIVARMGALAGPKYLIWVTHGFPIQFVSLTGQLMNYQGPLLGLAQTAARAGVAIYTVDQSAQGAGADVAGLARQTLEFVAEQTGGRWYSSGRTADALAGVATDTRASYRLAYFSPVRANAKASKIRIETTRKSIRLLTRAGSFGDATAPDPDEAAEDAFTRESHSPFEATEIPLRAAMSRKPVAIHLDIHVDAADVFLDHRGDTYRGSLSVKFALYRDGVFESAQPTIHQDLNLTQAQYDSALKNGIVVSRDVTVADQIQQVRAMVFDRGIQSLGSVTIPLQ